MVPAHDGSPPSDTLVRPPGRHPGAWRGPARTDRRGGGGAARGGPAGMMLGAELKLAGVDAVVIEPRLTPELSGARAGGRGLHTRTIEVFDMRGIAERFISQGQAMQVLGFNKVPIDISDFPTRHPYGLSLLQKHTERIMAEWIEEIGVNVLRGHEVVGFRQDD